MLRATGVLSYPVVTGLPGDLTGPAETAGDGGGTGVRHRIALAVATGRPLRLRSSSTPASATPTCGSTTPSRRC